MGHWRGPGPRRAAGGDMPWDLSWHTCTYPKAQRAACSPGGVIFANHTKRVFGLKTRLVIRLLTGLFTPEPSRGVIIGKLPVTGKWNLV